MLSMKHFEVAKYKVRPTFGTSTLPILINMNSWKKLTEEKGILLAAGEMTELQMPWIGTNCRLRRMLNLQSSG